VSFVAIKVLIARMAVSGCKRGALACEANMADSHLCCGANLLLIYKIVNSGGGILGVKKKRLRRKPEDAQAHILDAAEILMARGGGPAALRLQDVARQAGVSHPTILHHFGNREGLVRALNHRAAERLTEGAIAGMSSDSGYDGIKATFSAYRDGLAQRLIWLMQSPEQPAAARIELFERVVATFLRARKSFAAPGAAAPDLFDTRAVLHLVTIAAFGDALIGARLRHAGAKEAAKRAAFERWFSELLDGYLRAKATALRRETIAIDQE
jgi:AcrR family transcriptional regulator